jgi:hypothetical protein
MFHIYAALQNADLTEGRGPMIPRAHFTMENDCNAFLLTLDGIFGSRQGLECECVTVYEKLLECPDYREEVVRAQALSKLTEEEKKILGL